MHVDILMQNRKNKVIIMKYEKLGNSDIKISNIGLGSMVFTPNIYGDVDESQSIKVIQKAQNLGVTFIDTADAYGDGQNEQLVAKALGNSRQDMTIATKVGFLKNFQGVSNDPSYIKKSVDASLQRLNTDYIDLYYIHHLDTSVPIEESIGAMSDLVKAGKIRAIGLSNGITPELLIKAHDIHPISALQLEYNLWTREADKELFPLAKNLGITPVSYSPLSRGLMSGKIEANKNFESNDARNHFQRYQPDVLKQNVAVVNKLKDLATEKNITVAQLSLAWIISQGVVPIPGTKQIPYLEENVKAADITLTTNELAQLEDLSRNYKLLGEGGNVTI